MLARLPSLPRALRGASMGHAVALNAPEPHVCLPPVYPEERRATLLESTLVEVLILNTLNLFRMNTNWGRPRFAQFCGNVTPFRINTCKSVSKQTTLSLFRINTYEKQAGWGRGRARHSCRDRRLRSGRNYPRKSFPAISFADPHQLTPIESYR